MDVTILGSGTLFPNDGRRSAAHFIEAEGVRLLMDCGSGTVHALARPRPPTVPTGQIRQVQSVEPVEPVAPLEPEASPRGPIEWKQLTHLAISHFHTDHVGDIPALLFALKHGIGDERAEPLVILGPPGLRKFWASLAAAFGAQIEAPGFPLELVEMERMDAWTSADGCLRVRTHPTPHTETSIAFRVEMEEGVVGYTGDTGPDEALGRFFRGVDLLIAECSLPDPAPMKTHMTPLGLAALAAIARPSTMVATHAFPPLDPSQVPALVAAAGYAGPVLAGWDGLTLNINRTKG